jgi:HAD superfamily hydrolase (TIGR01484 family)
MPWRLVVTDLDGTVIDADGRPIADVISGLRRVQDMGIPIVAATGRSVVSFGELTAIDSLLDLCDHEILLDDADTVLDRRTGQTRCGASLSAEVIERVSAECLDYVATTGDRLTASSRRAATAYAIAYRVPRHKVEIGIAAELVRRLTIFDAPPAGIKGISIERISPFGATVLRPAHGGKAAGVAAWLRRRMSDASLGDVIAIGDGDNDAPLFLSSGASIAVRGSSPEAAGAASTCLEEPLGTYLARFDPQLIEPLASHRGGQPGD